MSQSSAAVQQWKELNAARLIQCRWGGTITREACRSYQLRRSRYSVYFRVGGTGYQRVNAEFVKCINPEPCPHFMTDEALQLLPGRAPLDALEKELEKRRTVAERRRLQRLVDPNESSTITLDSFVF